MLENVIGHIELWNVNRVLHESEENRGNKKKKRGVGTKSERTQGEKQMCKKEKSNVSHK